MKTLIVRYLPGLEYSYTLKILDAFKKKLGEKKIKYRELDLLNDEPDAFTSLSLTAYVTRNFMGKELTEDQKRSMKKMDRMTKEFKESDVVVVAFPMHNFSMPGPMKAYFDSVMQKGETWDIDENGGYVGFMKGKKALVLMASGGVYEGVMVSYEHGVSLARTEFVFMGFSDIRDVTIQGVNARKAEIDDITKKAKKKAEEIADEWYG